MVQLVRGLLGVPLQQPIHPHFTLALVRSHFSHLPSPLYSSPYLSSLSDLRPFPLLLPSSLCPLSSQRVAHMGEAVAGDMEWSAQAAAALHPNPTTAKYPAFLLRTAGILSGLQGRGVGVNTAIPSRSSPVAVQVQRWEGRGAVLHSAGAGRESIGIGSYETSSPSGGEFPSLPAAPLGGVRRFNGGSTAASRLKAPPPLTAAPDEYTPSIPSRFLRVGALKQGQESEVHPLTHLLLSPFSLPSQQHPTWTTVESPPSVHPPLPSTTPSPAA
ncbi:unnamed protein product [Closterium sp. NIES-65]|nr:unnamed protein product [Closterium sp. NIES-65]